MRKPYYWKQRKGWYVRVGKSQTFLHADEKKAYEAWAEMQRLGNPGAINATFATIADCFLAAAKPRDDAPRGEFTVKAKTYRGYEDDLLSACNYFGDVLIRELKKHHVTAWLDERTTWGAWARHRAAGAVKRAISWAVSEGHLDRDPLGKLNIPKGDRRDTLIASEAHAAMVQNVDHGRRPGKRLEQLGRQPVRRDLCFRPVLIALKHSGTRPGMVAALQADNVSPAVDAWIFHQHKTKGKTARPLIVTLSPCLQTLTRILLAARPSGALLLNSRRQPWTANAIRIRMANLQEKLGLPEGTVAYGYRHTFTTNAIVNGVDIATIATLLGHKDLRMLTEHYAHLEQQPEHLKEAAAKAMRRRA